MKEINQTQLDKFIIEEASKVMFNEISLDLDTEKIADTEQQIKGAEKRAIEQKERIDAKEKEKLAIEKTISVQPTPEERTVAQLRVGTTKDEIDFMKKGLEQTDAYKQEKEDDLKTLKNPPQEVRSGIDSSIESGMETMPTMSEGFCRSVLESINEERTPVMTRVFAHQQQDESILRGQKKAISPSQKVKKKNVIIQFGKGTKYPFYVNFTQRGFLIGETRLSFELLEKALSKNFTITLKDGFVLNNVRMQQILRYKNVY